VGKPAKYSYSYILIIVRANKRKVNDIFVGSKYTKELWGGHQFFKDHLRFMCDATAKTLNLTQRRQDAKKIKFWPDYLTLLKLGRR
jgi:hypothetical protein